MYNIIAGKRTLILILALLVLATSSAACANTNPVPVVINDSATTDSFIDLRSLEVSADTTYLTLKIISGGAIPTLSTPSLEAEGEYDFYILLDLDGNVSTGISSVMMYYAYAPEAEMEQAVAGVEAEIFTGYYFHNSPEGYEEESGGQARFYYPDGSPVEVDDRGGEGFAFTPEIVISGNTLTLSINLTEIREGYFEATGINLSDTSHIKIYIIYGSEEGFFGSGIYSGVGDYAVWEETNITVPVGDIVVDGDLSDWEGMSPSIIDDDSGFNSAVPEDANITSVYTATNNGILYVRIDFESSPMSPDDIYSSEYIYICITSGSTTYCADLDLEYGSGSSAIISYAATDSSIELAINASMVGYPELGPGDNVTFSEISVYKEYYDSIAEYMTYISYDLGEGGYIEEPPMGSIVVGEQTLNYSDTTLYINSTDYVGVVMGTYHEDPMGAGGAGLPEEYWDIRYFTVTDPDLITWPIIVEINYTNYLEEYPGINEEEITPYYYNKSLGAYAPLPSNYYSIDTANNIVRITITRELYELGDPAIILSPPPQPPTIGGELVAETPRATLTLLVALVTALILLIVTAMRRPLR